MGLINEVIDTLMPFAYIGLIKKQGLILQENILPDGDIPCLLVDDRDRIVSSGYIK